ncbi:bifunctional serine/threonine-protein kinase/glutamate ABC transporter substrate-binding protein [Streptomyces litchfieldiae]|uniref:Bifunctional serine/threonine-protein kinase/glutamate ABC transporter substrate-binding protein n=1 Tax=Streptomyces litchfieldiae TaxID=3075543 RepID=A0ABU2MMU1_9ACTN|nr:bifunctional serine/threonine-protein kinase/glutamate ABC transporter substrate-binding protein [Streptomyces sp. DSM 44938]MDT0342865.1 bifunctional serine/threonine-protein kinase/glutamate ABC transporter substrate-binding protein [Streptomyces sp. DSM 44938]
MEPLRSQDPKRMGEFTLLARLGSGGMGRVYLGRSPGGMQVAIKVIREDFADDADALARFRREVATVRAVRSPYTARLVDAALDAPPYWLATEFVPGPTLLAAARGAPLEPALCTGLFAALAEALAAVHAHGVVHRDVKPHNVVLGPGGPQLIDFGIARAAEHTQLTRTGQTPGTVGYTAPEVLLGGGAGPAADVFALGATMAAAATGRAPYGGGEWAAVSYRVVHGEIDVDGVEPGLAALIRQCVARDPAARPEPREIVRRCGVTHALAALPAYQRLAATTPPPTPPAAPRRRAPLVATAALAVGGLAVATVVWLLPEGGDDATAGDSPSDSVSDSPDESGSDAGSDGDNGDDGGRDSLTIGIKFDEPGMGLLTPEGDHTGFDVEVARYIARELGVEEQDITWVEAPSIERENLLTHGRVDFLVASYQITEDRDTRVDFAGPYLSTHQDLLIRADDEVNNIAEINDLTLCSVTGSTPAQVVQNGLAPDVDITERPSYAECLGALRYGGVDALTTDDALLAGYASQSGHPDRYRLAELRLSTEYDYGVGLPQGETELRDAINAAIARMIEDGSWAAAVEANLGAVENYDPQPPEVPTATG